MSPAFAHIVTLSAFPTVVLLSFAGLVGLARGWARGRDAAMSHTYQGNKDK